MQCRSYLQFCTVVWSSRRIQGALPKTRKTFGGLVLVDFDTGLNLSKAAGLASGQRVPRRTTLAPVPLTLHPFSAFCPRRTIPTCHYLPVPVLASPYLPAIHPFRPDQTRNWDWEPQLELETGTAPLLALASVWHHLFSVRLRLAQKSRQVINPTPVCLSSHSTASLVLSSSSALQHLRENLLFLLFPQHLLPLLATQGWPHLLLLHHPTPRRFRPHPRLHRACGLPRSRCRCR